MSTGEFIKFIESIGFEYNGFYFHYKKYKIDLYYECYDFYDGSEWIYSIVLNDLRLLRKLDRSYKLKKILK